MNYSPNVQYPPMMGQPGPQMGGIGTPGQPRSPMVHSLQAQVTVPPSLPLHLLLGANDRPALSFGRWPSLSHGSWIHRTSGRPTLHGAAFCTRSPPLYWAILRFWWPPINGRPFFRLDPVTWPRVRPRPFFCPGRLPVYRRTWLSVGCLHRPPLELGSSFRWRPAVCSWRARLHWRLPRESPVAPDAPAPVCASSGRGSSFRR